jgi:hypothetical protein
MNVNCRPVIRSFAILLTVWCFTACVTRTATEPHQFLDERTARTLWVPAKPLVFARNRSDLAAYARDYATLVPVAIDESGDYRQYLLLYRWSTVDPRMLPRPDPGDGELRIVADGRVIDLHPLTTLPLGLDRHRELLIPKHGDVVAHAYKMSSDLLRYIAASHELSVRLPQEPFTTPFELWQDGRPALRAFLSRADAP